MVRSFAPLGLDNVERAELTSLAPPEHGSSVGAAGSDRTGLC
jgi:hypothetical protein